MVDCQTPNQICKQKASIILQAKDLWQIALIPEIRGYDLTGWNPVKRQNKELKNFIPYLI